MDIRGIGRFIRLFLFSRGNKEFLIFLFFLALSGAFWLSLTLNDTYEQEFAVPVAVVDVPKNAVLTSDEVDTVKMTIRDKGIFLISYYYGDYLKNIRIHFRSHSHNNGTGTIAAQELQKIVYSRLFSSSKILSTSPNVGMVSSVPPSFSSGRSSRVQSSMTPSLPVILFSRES